MAASERGRKQLPATLRYVALSRFEEDGSGWPDGAWTVELLFDEPPAEQSTTHGSSIGTVRFLFDHAPHERLTSGIRFDIFEGPTRVAEVEVLD